MKKQVKKFSQFIMESIDRDMTIRYTDFVKFIL